MFSDYEVVIGLEVHAELKTKTKVFCSCKNEFGSEPNSNCCPVCVGMPGALPVLSKEAVFLTIKAGLTIGSQISPLAVFERKNYFYPDLAKAYQISQLEKPICVGGGIKLKSGKNIRINRIHLEEDAGKLIHKSEVIGTFIDYNRGGVPLIEMVTEPDISSAEEAVEFLTKYRRNLIFASVADCKMQEGGMRCDVNLSVRKKGDKKLGTRTEMKNLNSFKSVQRAITYEAKRQIEELEKGNAIRQETRKWDDNKNRSFTMRSKEEAEDYRYFPDPDLLPVRISEKTITKAKAELPELSEQKRERYVREFSLPKYDAEILTNELDTALLFEEASRLTNMPKQVSNFIMTYVLAKKKERDNLSVFDVISADNLAYIIKAISTNELTRPNALMLFDMVCFTDKDAKSEAVKSGFISKLSEAELESVVDFLIEQNAQAVKDYKLNQVKVENFFMGQLMKQTKGKADVNKGRTLINEKLQKYKN